MNLVHQVLSGKTITGERVERVCKERTFGYHTVSTIPFGITRRFCIDGSVGYHSITMTPVYEGNDVVGFEGYIFDKTDTKLAELELEKSKV